MMEGCRRPVSLQLYGIDAKDEQTLLFDSGQTSAVVHTLWPRLPNEAAFLTQAYSPNAAR